MLQAESLTRSSSVGAPKHADLAVETADAKRELEERGYAHVRGACTASDVKTISAILEKLWRKRVGFNEGNFYDLVSDDDEGTKPMKFPQIINPNEAAPELRKTAYFKRIEAMAKELLGPEARFSFDHALRKAPLDGPLTPWHQDVAFRDPSIEYRELSFWMALQPTTMENGCMRFIPGSHKGGLLEHRPFQNNPKIHVLECCGSFDEDSAEYVPLDTGDMTIHTGLTLHGAGPNTSNGYRAGYVIIFELPPRPLETGAVSPWLANRETTRQMRARRWRSNRLNVAVRAWRYVRRNELTSLSAWQSLASRMLQRSGMIKRRVG